MRTLGACAGIATLVPIATQAHTLVEPSGSAGEWVLLALLFTTATIYIIGLSCLWRACRYGKNELRKHALLFNAGWLVIAGSLLSPLHRLGATSFTMHMIEHELLMLVAAPLIALSKPIGVLLWGLPRRARRALGHVSHDAWFAEVWAALCAPLMATAIQTIMLWLWHAPTLFNRALASEGWHAAQHLSLMFSALLFWWSMNRVAMSRSRHGVAVVYLFFTSMQSGFLGAIMTFAQSPWYGQYAAMGMSGVGELSPLEDQQIAGLIMWIPGGALHALAALLYLGLSFCIPHAGTINKVPDVAV